MGPRRVEIDIERIVLDGIALDAAGIEAMRAVIAAELTDWLSGADSEALQASLTPRVAPPAQTVASLADGRALGHSVAQAVQAAVERPGARP